MSQDKLEGRTNFLDIDSYQDSITLVELLFIISRKWKIIVATIFLTVTVIMAITILKPDVYEAEVTLIVSSGQVHSLDRIENDDISRNQRLVATYAEIARSKSIMLNVIKNLDLEMAPEEISKLVKMTPVKETELIKVSYRDKNPQKAAMLANEVSKEFIKKINEVMSFQNLKIVEKAQIPEKAISDKIVAVVAASTVLGCLLGIFLALVSEFLYGKLRKPEDIEQIMGCQILANLPKYNNFKEGDSNGS